MLDRRDLLVSAVGLAAAPAPAFAASEAGPPNILLVVADDLGFLDLGCFGGEIRTPNLDALAAAGVRFTDFTVAPACSQTRAMLLTGVDHHLAGLGAFAELMQANQRGRPGYEGGLNDRVVTIAEVLGGAGYRTLVSGKWHVGREPGADPSARGFERSFVLLGGAHNHFGEDQSVGRPGGGGTDYREDGVAVAVPGPFYSSDLFADRLIAQIEGPPGDRRPIFAYLPFTAPHVPLQAPAGDIARYRGRYDAGWGELRRERIARARETGVVGDFPVDPAPGLDVAWAALDPRQRALEARRMEVYAAMVDRMDQALGRVLSRLRETGRLRNTAVVFLSDNGAEGGRLADLDGPAGAYYAALEATTDNTLEGLGGPRSYAWLGPHWANACNGPLLLHKHYPTAGGIRVPLLVTDLRYPGGGTIARSFASVLDIAPTLADLAGARPASRPGRLAFEGRSLAATVATGAPAHGPAEAFGWELHGRKALRRGTLKAVQVELSPTAPGPWRLYDLAADPYETADLAAARPELTAELARTWDAYAARVGVVTPERLGL
jgi:arylsulfatase A-like enzyme